MKTALWLALHLSPNLAWSSPLAGPQPAWDPIPQELHPGFQLGGLSKRGGQGHEGQGHGGQGHGGQGQGRPVNIDLSVWGQIPGVELQWYGEITVGSPPQKFKLIFDTGASMMLIAHKNCTTCGNQPLYDPSKSSTSSPLPGYKVLATFNSGGGGTRGGNETQGGNCTALTDVVRMGGRGVTADFLACDTYSSGLRDQDPDGLFGMSSTPYANWMLFDNSTRHKPVYWHLVQSGQIPSAEFGISFVADRKGPNGRAGVITLGGTDRSQYIPGTLKKIPLNWPLSESRWRWVVDVRGARVERFTLTNSTDAVALVDTGFPTIVTPDRNTTAELYGSLSPQFRPLDEFGAWGAPCAVVDRAARDVTFTVGSPEQKTDVVVKKKYFNVGEYPGMPGICQGVYADPARVAREPINGRPAWIFGSPWLRSYYTVWNGVDRTLGFATPAHKDWNS